jgi:hypothetical protein
MEKSQEIQQDLVPAKEEKVAGDIVPQENKISRATLRALTLHKDLSKLTEDQQLQYVMNIYKALDIAPIFNVFSLIKLQGKMVLYADKDCASLLAKKHRITTQLVERDMDKETGLYRVTMRASDAAGRFAIDDGILWVGDAKGQRLADSMMKCMSKARRRSIFSLLGLSAVTDDDIEFQHREQRHDLQEIFRAKEQEDELRQDGINFDEDEVLKHRKLAIYNALIGSDKKFGFDVKKAKEWVEELTDHGWDGLTHDDCDVLESKLADGEKD